MKKLFILILCLTMAFGSLRADAMGMINNSVIDLSRQAQHYYNTNIAYADMMVYRITENMYEIVYGTEHYDVVKVQLYKTDWGTWNLGNMNVIVDGIEKIVIGGGTDWEYVMRVVNPINQHLEFTGGNHGSEVCNWISMYDDVTGAAVNLQVGESQYVNRLVVEENTTIFLANLDYLPYANVKRVYTIVADVVSLDCEITFTRDVKVAQVYSTMACVNKDFGTICKFDEGTTEYTAGKGFCSGKYLGNVPSVDCTLSGADTSVSVNVGIYNKTDMTDNFSNREKTFIWDMSENYTKLYFSRGNLTDASVVKSGTVWNFSSYWKVNILK